MVGFVANADLVLMIREFSFDTKTSELVGQGGADQK